MAVATMIALVVRACLTMGVISLASVASAQDISDASIAPQDTNEYLTKWTMALVVESPEKVSFGSPYDVVPLTIEAGLQQPDASKVRIYMFLDATYHPFAPCYAVKP